MGRPRIYSDEERAIRRKESARRRDAKRLKNLTPEQRERRRQADARYKSRRVLTPEQRAKLNARITRWRKNRPAEKLEREKLYKQQYNKTYKLSEEQRKAVRERSAAHYKANKERIAARHAQWHRENPEAARIYAQNRRERKRRNMGQLSPDIVAILFAKQRGHCAVCRGEFEKRLLELDHVIPLARGGLHADENMQLLCRTCNRQKGTSDPVDFMQRKGLLL